MTDTSARDGKLIQYLNEAYGTETHLETALQAHITMASDVKYRRRLKEHLTETKRHAREVRQRVKKLGGTAEAVPAPGPDLLSEAAGVVLGGAEKAIALAQGPLHAIRGTGAEEKQLKNAKTEYASEAQEIATYRAIETLAAAVGDSETVQLARTIRRDEERMRTFLEREIPRLTKAVVNAEIPAAERRPSSRKRPAGAKARSAATKRSSGGRAASASTRAKAATARGAKAATSAKAAARGRRGATATHTKEAASAKRAKASTSRSKAGSSRSKAGSSRAVGSRAKAAATRSKVSGTRSRAGARARSGAKAG